MALFLEEGKNILTIDSRNSLFQKFFIVLTLFLTIAIVYAFYLSGTPLGKTIIYMIIWVVLAVFFTTLFILSKLKIVITKEDGRFLLEDRSFYIGNKKEPKRFDRIRSKLIVEERGKKYFVSIFDGENLIKINPTDRKIAGIGRHILEAVKRMTGNKYIPFTRDQVERISGFLKIQRTTPNKLAKLYK